MPFKLEQIRDSLGRHRPQRLERAPDHSEAAVALVLAGGRRELSLCMIRRAEHPLDPWSGHMALPGGRAGAADASPRHVAERETFEEVGLALTEAAALGPLSDMLVRIGGGGRGMILSPFVFHLEEPAPLVPQQAEVAEAFWVPLGHFWDPRNAGHVEWERGGTRLSYPAIRFRGHPIWGITFRVLTLFSDVLGTPLPHLEEIPGLGR